MKRREFEAEAARIARTAGLDEAAVRAALFRDPHFARRLRALDARVRRDQLREMAREDETADAWLDYLEGDGPGSSSYMSTEESRLYEAWDELTAVSE